MKTILITIFISLSLSASAQFNTIAPAGSHLNKKATAKVTDTTAVVSNNSSEEEREEDLPVTDKAVDWYHPPLKGKLHITSSFGKKKSEHHNGLDLSAKAGTPIYAMLPDEVSHIGYGPRQTQYPNWFKSLSRSTNSPCRLNRSLHRSTSSYHPQKKWPRVIDPVILLRLS